MNIAKIKKAPILVKILLSVLGITSGLLLLEFYERNTQTTFALPLDCYQVDTSLNHSLVPSKICAFNGPEWNITYQINSLGMRDDEISTEKPQNKFRILMVGDSFTEGWGIQEEFTSASQLEKILNDETGNPHFEVINMGVSSYSPIIEYLQLLKLGLKLKPDMVILNLDPTDFRDDVNYSKVSEFDPKGIPVKVHPPDPTHFKAVVERITKNGNLQTKSPKFLSNTPILNKSFLMRKLSSLVIANGDTQAEVPEPDDIAIKLTEKYLLLIKDLLVQNQITFIISAYPYKNHLQESFPIYVSEIEAFSRQNQINYINLFPLVKNKKSENLYFKFDRHGNNKFHRIIAEGIYNYLSVNNLIQK